MTATSGIQSGTGTTDSADSADSAISNSAQSRDDAHRASLRAMGFNDDQINAILALADPDDQGNSLLPMHFSLLNKETLNTLQYSGNMDGLAKELVFLQAPIALVNEVSNPANWKNGLYTGPGASKVNAYILGESVDFSEPSLDALVMSVLTSRAEIIETQLRDQITGIQGRNSDLEEANGWLARAKQGKKNESAFTQEFKDYWSSLGATHQGNASTSDDWEVNIQSLKGKIEGMTSQSQLETTKLQQTINKYNQSFEMLSNFINKYYQSISSIIQNLR
ncbi:hypothetical protein CI610_01261 [invertebrate metagenome]|uniref:Uncharacterized protein n=1 Tax=invertebrate metagenome TaxID=1711999 RepID=A0A2H9T985_9ZZZZ